jgi:hypothetical protein
MQKQEILHATVMDAPICIIAFKWSSSCGAISSIAGFRPYISAWRVHALDFGLHQPTFDPLL